MNKKWLKKKLPLYLLMIGLAVIMIRLIQAQPVEVTVVYHYGEASKGLVSSTMSYQRGPEELRSVKFKYQGHKADSTQAHKVQLSRGNYQVAIELSYQDKTKLLRRPLIVSGAEQVSIFLAN